MILPRKLPRMHAQRNSVQGMVWGTSANPAFTQSQGRPIRDLIELESELHYLIATTRTSQLLIEKFCSLIAAKPGYDEPWIVVFDHDHHPRQFARAGYRIGDARKLTEHTALLPCMHQIISGKSEVEFGPDPELEKTNTCDNSNSHESFSGIRVAMRSHTRLIGVLGINWQHTQRLCQVEVDVLKSMANSLAFAIAHLSEQERLTKCQTLSGEHPEPVSLSVANLSHNSQRTLKTVKAKVESLLDANEHIFKRFILNDHLESCQLLAKTLLRIASHAENDLSSPFWSENAEVLSDWIPSHIAQLAENHSACHWQVHNGLPNQQVFKPHVRHRFPKAALLLILEELLPRLGSDALDPAHIEFGTDGKHLLLRLSEKHSSETPAIPQTIGSEKNAQPSKVHVFRDYRILLCSRTAEAAGGFLYGVRNFSDSCSWELSIPITEVADNHEVDSSILNPPQTGVHKDAAHVLIAEDSDLDAMVIKMMLEKLGCKVTRVSDGKSALHLCSTFKFNLLVLDLNMPRIDGYVTADMIRSQCCVNGNTPILMLSADHDRLSNEHCRAHQVEDYLSKPATFATLQEKLRALLPEFSFTQFTASSHSLNSTKQSSVLSAQY